MKSFRLIEAVYLLVAIALGYSSAGATQLIFEQVRYDGIVYSAFNDGVVPKDYGDRVTGLTQTVSGGIFSYGNLGEGFTPNVEIAYGPYAESASLWWDTFGDLSHVLWTNVRAPFQVTLVADPGFLVQLHGFDMAGWPNSDYTIGAIVILDGANNTLFSQSNVYVEGDFNGPRHSHFEFDSMLASTVILYIDPTNLYSYYLNIGLDNLRFSQVELSVEQLPAVSLIGSPEEIGPSRGAPAAVPEPSSLFLLTAGVLSAVYSRWRNN